jgi:hypothetical protein
MNFPENLRNPARIRRAGLTRQFRPGQVYSNSSKFRPWQHLESPYIYLWAKSYCSFGKMGNPGTNVDFAFFQNRMVNPYGKFSEPCFPHNFAENYRRELKMGCTDASRRQLQFVLKIGV